MGVKKFTLVNPKCRVVYRGSINACAHYLKHGAFYIEQFQLNDRTYKFIVHTSRGVDEPMEHLEYYAYN